MTNITIYCLGEGNRASRIVTEQEEIITEQAQIRRKRRKHAIRTNFPANSSVEKHNSAAREKLQNHNNNFKC